MRKITSVLAAFAATLSFTGAAQQLTLEECVSLALENNARIRTSEYSVKASRETSREAFTN